MATVAVPAGTTKKLPVAFNRLAWPNLAAQISLAAPPIVAVLALGAGAGETGLLRAAQTLPFLLLAIPAGILADRTSRRRLMACAEALRMGALLSILILTHLSVLTLHLLAALGFIGATVPVAYSVSAPSLIPALVLRTQLAAANSRLELDRSVAFVAGPALGGLFVGGVGAGPTYAIATTLSGIAVVFLLSLKEPARQPVPKRTPLAELNEGARFVLTHQLLRPILFTAVFFNIAFFVLQAIYVPYAHRHLGLSAGAIGITLYGGRSVACRHDHAPPVVWPDNPDRTIHGSGGVTRDGSDDLGAESAHRRTELFPDRHGSDALDDQLDNITASGNTGRHAWPGFCPDHNRHLGWPPDLGGDRGNRRQFDLASRLPARRRDWLRHPGNRDRHFRSGAANDPSRADPISESRQLIRSDPIVSSVRWSE